MKITIETIICIFSKSAQNVSFETHSLRNLRYTDRRDQRWFEVILDRRCFDFLLNCLDIASFWSVSRILLQA